MLVGRDRRRQAMLDLLDPDGTAPLLLSGPRAAALASAMSATPPIPARRCVVARCDWLDQDAALALADPGRDFDRAPIGPLAADRRSTTPSAARRRSTLARLAGLLPALWLVDADSRRHGVDSTRADARPPAPTRPSSPAPSCRSTTCRRARWSSFRDPASGEEHVALVVGAFGGEPPLVRLHSECLTGDVFGSLKCDCGPQLQARRCG